MINERTYHHFSVTRVLQIILPLIWLMFSVIPAAAQDDLTVTGDWLRYSDQENSLYHHLTGEALQLLSERADMVQNLATQEEWKERQQEVRETLLDIVGPLPEKTPLNARVTGVVRKADYRVENVIYESMHKFPVTASLFIPNEVRTPAPAILFCSGHSTIAYRRPYYQLPLLNLVKKGFIVLAIDPIGQGERLQYYNPETGESDIGSSTTEHSYPSAQTYLSGVSIARYFTWDGIRGIDYLLTRPEVDPDRIGCHGLSGGGTQTAYISALDDRVYASAPAGYITSYRRLMESDGVQDGEQNLYHGIVSQIDHGDFLEVRAPKPTLIVATTRDFFSIQGVRETYAEAGNAFQAFGQPENLSITEDDHGHGYTLKNREVIYAFFQKHLNLPGSSTEEEVEYLTPEELRKTETGQTLNSLDCETVYSINKQETEGLLSDLKASRTQIVSHLGTVMTSARRLSGYREPEMASQAYFTGRFQRDGYLLEKYFIPGEGEYVIPFVAMIPERNATGKAILYLHPRRKAAVAGSGGEIETLVRQGYTVVAPDLIGVGEMGPGEFTGDAYIDNISFNQWYNSILIGRSIAGVRAADVVKLTKFLKSWSRIRVTGVSGMAMGEMGSVLLHAAAFDNSIDEVVLIEPLATFKSVAMNRYYDPKYIQNSVAGALAAYDLPDLAALVAPRNLTLINSTDQNGLIYDISEIEGEYKVTGTAYQAKNAAKNFKLLKGDPENLLMEVFTP